MNLTPTPADRARRLLLQGFLALPAPLRARLFGPPPVNDRGDPLDPDTWIICALDRHAGPGIATPDPVDARRAMRASCATILPAPRRTVATRDLALGGRPARVYTPRAATGLPAMLYLHGGGWVVGDLDTHDAFCRRLAHEGRRLVVSLDYRLAPEHPFPAGLDDVMAAWLALPALAEELGADVDHLEVGGDSAGGNLSLALALRCVDEGRRVPDAMLLIYPATDLRRQTASYHALGEGYLLDKATMDIYIRAYAAPAPTHPLASVALHPCLDALPRCVVTTAGFDPLRDEGEALARALAAQGRLAAHLHEPGLIHGYAVMDAVLPAADAAVARIMAAVAALRPS